MALRRPTSVTVIAIFHFIIGGIGLLCNLCGTIGLLAQDSMMKSMGNSPQMREAMADQRILEDKAPQYKPYMAAQMAIKWVLTLALLIGGVGLMQMKSWGRSMSIGYAGISLLEKVASAFYVIVFMLPAYDAVYEAQKFRADTTEKQKVAEMQGSVGKTTAVITPFISMIYPAIVMMVMLNPKVAAAFQGGEADSRDPEDDFDDEYIRRHRNAVDPNRGRRARDEPDDRYQPGDPHDR